MSRRHSIARLKNSQLEKAFKDADRDKDGCLTKDEYFKVRNTKFPAYLRNR